MSWHNSHRYKASILLLKSTACSFDHMKCMWPRCCQASSLQGRMSKYRPCISDSPLMGTPGIRTSSRENSPPCKMYIEIIEKEGLMLSSLFCRLGSWSGNLSTNYWRGQIIPDKKCSWWEKYSPSMKRDRACNPVQPAKQGGICKKN